MSAMSSIYIYIYLCVCQHIYECNVFYIYLCVSQQVMSAMSSIYIMCKSTSNVLSVLGFLGDYHGIFFVRVLSVLGFHGIPEKPGIIMGFFLFLPAKKCYGYISFYANTVLNL